MTNFHRPDDNPVTAPDSRAGDGACPYGDLYIYYFDGIVEANAFSSEKNFLGNWREDRCSFLFFSRPAHGVVETFLETRPELNLLDRFHLDYSHWQGKDLAPFQVGPLRVAPYWFQEEGCGIPSNAARPLFIDPGLVFGSGAHPTTLDCLRALVVLYEQETPLTILDLGTGTGLLALAAVKLGSKKVLAVDLNPLAAKTVRKNIRINQMEDKILAIQGDAEDFIDYPFDLVIANIHYDVMRRLLPAKGFIRKRWLLLSGLMRSEAHALLETPIFHRFESVGSWTHEGIWHTYLLKQRGVALG